MTKTMCARDGRKFSDREVIEAFEQSDEPFLTSVELAKKFHVSRQGMNERLRKLWNGGDLRRKPCASGYAYWLSDGDGSASA